MKFVESPVALERIRMEEALRQAQQRLYHLLAHSPVLLYSLQAHSAGFVPLWLSDNIEPLLGYTPSEACAANWWAGCVHPQDHEAVLTRQARLLVDGRQAQEYRIRHKNGAYRWIRDEQHLVRDALGQPSEVLGSWIDITERKQLEEQFHQAQKMEAIGQLAGGVAHDFNNLLTVIRGCTEMVLMTDPTLTLRSKDLLNEVLASSKRAANLTRQLLAFGRKQLLEPHPLNLNEVIGNLSNMLARLIGETIRLRCSYAQGLPNVQADVSMLEQLLMNLVINARDAMPGGGEIFISTDSLTLDRHQAQAHPDGRPGLFVRLTLRDTGQGIAPEHIPHLFEPFFTTKEPGKGTGLGLATVYGIVKQHEGWIELTSTVGQGTAFAIYLPACSRAAALNLERPLAPVQGGSETILLVEDDEPVRALAQRILETMGYRILPATSGKAALEIWRRHPAQIDLVLTDVVMPDGLSGRELAERLWAERLSLRIIFTSGYSAEFLSQDSQPLRGPKAWFLPKPYAWRALVNLVRECLDSH